jgi:hypothetical protein
LAAGAASGVGMRTCSTDSGARCATR